jgi:hypothetical protein
MKQSPVMTYPFVLRAEKTLAMEMYNQLTNLFNQEGTWTSGWFACRRDGRSCSFASKDATSFDVIGALGRIALSMKDKELSPRLISKAQSLVTWSLIDAVWKRGHPFDHMDSPLVQWNDNVCKSRFEALSLVEEGEDLLKSDVQVH